MKIPLSPVQSSTISGMGYDAESETLHVRFASGKVYAYKGVKPEHFEQFNASESKGSHFGKFIRNQFQGVALPEEKSEGGL